VDSWAVNKIPRGPLFLMYSTSRDGKQTVVFYIMLWDNITNKAESSRSGETKTRQCLQESVTLYDYTHLNTTEK